MKAEVLISFGSHLRSIRLNKNLSQVELAYKGGFDRNYIGMLERGERNPSLINLVRLSKALNIQLKDLLDFKTIK